VVGSPGPADPCQRYRDAIATYEARSLALSDLLADAPGPEKRDLLRQIGQIEQQRAAAERALAACEQQPFPPASAGCVVSWGFGRLDAVYRAPDGTLGHVWYDNRTGWGGPESRGGQVVERPAIVSRGQYLLDIVACTPKEEVAHIGYDDSIGWTGWTDVGGSFYPGLIGPPAAVAVSQETVHVAARATSATRVGQPLNEFMIDAWSTGTTWTQPLKPLSVPQVNSPLAGVSRGPQQLDFAVLGLTAPLWQVHGFIDPTGSGDWLWSGVANSRLPSDPRLADTPAIVSWDSSRLDVFALGEDRAIWHTWFQEPGPWKSWDSLGGSMISSPTAVSRSPGSLDVFAIGDDGHLYHSEWAGGNTGWIDRGGSLVTTPSFTSPSAVAWSSQRLDVFAKQSDGTLGHTWWDPSIMSNWGAWETRGGPIA
jgi:hypothetical protein